jgi:hypothetical protein
LRAPWRFADHFEGFPAAADAEDTALPYSHHESTPLRSLMVLRSLETVAGDGVERMVRRGDDFAGVVEAEREDALDAVLDGGQDDSSGRVDDRGRTAGLDDVGESLEAQLGEFEFEGAVAVGVYVRQPFGRTQDGEEDLAFRVSEFEVYDLPVGRNFGVRVFAIGERGQYALTDLERFNGRVGVYVSIEVRAGDARHGECRDECARDETRTQPRAAGQVRGTRCASSESLSEAEHAVAYKREDESGGGGSAIWYLDEYSARISSRYQWSNDG